MARQALAAPVRLSRVLTRSRLPPSLFNKLILLLFAFLQGAPCSGNAVLQREVSHGREGSLPSFV